MKLIAYIKKNGILYALKILYEYKLDKIIRAMMDPVLKNRPLKNIIVIESHNDFDCNGGAFYQYLISHNYNSKYKIVWLLKNYRRNIELPHNVTCVPLLKPSIRKDYYICMAKIITTDNNIVKKARGDQKEYYFTHGGVSLKNVKGVCNIPDYVDYILMSSESYAPIQVKQWQLPYPSERLIYFGYPVHDVLNSAHPHELKKITKKHYNKIILWMPTFRRGGGHNRNDSYKKQPLGIPLIENEIQLKELNAHLSRLDVLLIIKLHPMQDLTGISISNKPNITVLTGQDVKRLEIDNYRLLGCTDALISDYSSIAYDYLQLNKPIGYVLDDINEYKLGFVVDDIHTLMAGHEIYTLDDLKKYICDVVNENDVYMDRRKDMLQYIYKYNDTDNCKRIVEFMKL